MYGLASATEVYRNAFAAGLEPDADILISEWAEKNRVLPAETTSYPGRWQNSLVPYLIEIQDCLSPSHPCDTVSFKKSAQIAGSEAIMNMIGFIADAAPGPAMLVHPTIDAGKAWVREKLNPNIDGNPVLRRKVVEQKSRDGAGSSALFKKFPGGFLVITGANSAAALRQKSIRWLIKDDWDEWPLDVAGQGDPDKMADARQISFHNSGTAKKFQVSTPTVKSISRIHHAYERSDQRVFKVKCPTCTEEQELRFFPLSREPFKGGLKFSKEPPHMAYYVCEHNGCIIEHHQKRLMLASGRWVALNPGPGRHPGFYLNALYSPFTTWDKMVEAFLAAKNNPRELKTFFNLWLGLAWEERGDAPDWKRLLTLREDYPLGHIPVGALVITTAVDVQKDGFYYEVVGWGPGLSSWVIDIGFLPGDTARPEAYALLDELYGRTYLNAWGRSFPTDFMAIDTGYNTHRVYEWVRRKPQNKVAAVKGVGGAHAPILGTPARMDVKFSGTKKRKGLRVWPVGTWPAKTEFYALLRLEGVREGRERDPAGYCHFSNGCDENYFKQLTAESLVTHQRNGRETTEWVQSGENHFLDCRIYNRACAEILKLARFTQADWENLAIVRNVPIESLQGDLFALQTAARIKAPPEKPDVPKPPKAEAEADPANDQGSHEGEGVPEGPPALPQTPPQTPPPPVSAPPGRTRMRRVRKINMNLRH